MSLKYEPVSVKSNPPTPNTPNPITQDPTLKPLDLEPNTPNLKPYILDLQPSTQNTRLHL